MTEPACPFAPDCTDPDHAMPGAGDELSPDAMQWEPAPTPVEIAAWELVKRCRRMLNDWSESAPEVRARDLWAPLHAASEELADALTDDEPEFDAHTLRALGINR